MGSHPLQQRPNHKEVKQVLSRLSIRPTPLILAVSLFMEMMDANVIATSLPAIANDIGASPVALKLAMTAYLVALAIFIPISGWFADRFGAKRVFLWAIVVFALGSIACAASNSLETFVFARFFQGMGGSMMTPLARLILIKSTPKKELVNAMSWLVVPALLGPLIGPPVGGYLTTYFSWHWIFLINVPIAAIGIVACVIFLPAIDRQPVPRIDWIGFVLCGTAFSGVLFGLSVISLPALPPVVGVATMIIGLAAGLVYLSHAFRTPFPILDLELFAQRIFRNSMLGGFLLRLGLGAMPFLLPLMLQLSFGMTPFDAGMIMIYGAVGSMIMKFLAPPIYARFGFKYPLVVAGIFCAAALGMLSFANISTPMWHIGVIMFITGFSRSCFFTGVNALCFGDVPDRLAGQASAMFAVSIQLGLAVGVAVGGGVLELFSAFHAEGPTVSDFQHAFLLVAIVSLCGVIPIALFKNDVGADMSGRKTKAEAISEPVVTGK